MSKRLSERKELVVPLLLIGGGLFVIFFLLRFLLSEEPEDLYGQAKSETREEAESQVAGLATEDEELMFAGDATPRPFTRSFSVPSPTPTSSPSSPTSTSTPSPTSTPSTSSPTPTPTPTPTPCDNNCQNATTTLSLAINAVKTDDKTVFYSSLAGDLTESFTASEAASLFSPFSSATLVSMNSGCSDWCLGKIQAATGSGSLVNYDVIMHWENNAWKIFGIEE